MKKILTVLAVTAFMFFLLIGYSTNVNSTLSQNIVRLHVLANSDSDQDQALKLKVRDAILSHSRANFTKKSDVESKLDEYREIAETVIEENGYDYPVTVEYGNFNFPTKEYENLRLPAGNYDAVRVKIGNAEGKNWWCVMFPPLCLDAAVSTPKYTAEEEVLISKKYNIKFKLLELISEITRY